MYKCEHTRRVDPATLRPHPKNPHKHPTSQIDALARSIERFGWRFPIVVSNQTGLIIAGHCRRAAAIKLGCEAPVDYQDFDSEADELAVLMADNIIPELAEFDVELKLVNIEELKLANIELATIGADSVDHGSCGYDDDIDIPEIQIDEKLSLERITIFVEETIKAEFLKKLRAIADQYDNRLVRIVT